jgi:hypothetical protein
MRKAASILSALVFLVVAPGAGAQHIVDPKKVPITPGFEAQEAADCPETSEKCKLICKFFDPPTGTRLGGHTECRTAYWWEDRMRQDQGALLKLQQDETHMALHF